MRGRIICGRQQKNKEGKGIVNKTIQGYHIKKVKDTVYKKFTIKMQKKLVVLFIFVLLAFAGLSVQLFRITNEKGEKYKKQVLSQQKYNSISIPYRRGNILDCKGNYLATSEKVYNLVIDASVMTYKEEYIEPTLQALDENFDLDIAQIREHITNNKNSAYYVVLKRLTYDQISGFKEAEAKAQEEARKAKKECKIKGVWFEEEYKRTYPNGSLASDVIGFTRTDNSGLYGLEEYYNDILSGIDGREYGYLNDDSSLERTLKAAVDGNNIHSTIDVNIQKIVEKYLKQFNDEHANAVREGNGAENLGCVIMEVNTGNVLAMAEYPTYDLNDPRNTEKMIGSVMVEEVTNANGYIEIHKTDTVINEAVISSMNDDQVYLNLNNLWKSFCISNTYEPGSTAKPFTVAAALEAGAITGNEVYTCNGALVRGGHTIHCHARSGEGSVSVQSAIAWSCNVALMHIGEALGKENFSKFQQIFNFGLKTNIDLAGEARTAGLLFSAEEMGDADLATNTFGQNFNVTMIQMITGFCSLINGGYYYEPHMVSKITNAHGATVENIEPRVLRQTVSNTTSEKIRQYCRATVMEEGGARRTGKTARPAGYAIGGKTGTAQTLPRGNKEYVVSFIGYAPADDPQIAIYVVVDRANAEKQDSATFATGIVRNILTEVLPYKNIFMTEELSEEEKAELEAKQLEITSQYMQTPEGDALESAEGESSAEGEGSTGESSSEGESGNPPWMSYPIDPETGYRKNPETGELLDPETGNPIGAAYEAIDYGNIPSPAQQDSQSPY